MAEHRWGPWEEDVPGEKEFWRPYFWRKCLDCPKIETAEERYLCDVRNGS